MIEQVYNRYYDTVGNYHWIGVHSGEHILRKGEKMTREEAVKWLERIEERYIHGGDEAFDEERKEALHMAIETLEKPKDEAIYDYLMSRNQLLVSQELFRSLQPKSGMWIPLNPGDYGYSAGDFICSCCGKPNKCYSVTDYCASCGAQMQRGEKHE